MDERSGAASTHGSSPARSDDQDADLARAWAVLGRVHERNAHLDPNETFAEVTAEVEAVRQELYERRRAVR